MCTRCDRVSRGEMHFWRPLGTHPEIFTKPILQKNELNSIFKQLRAEEEGAVPLREGGGMPLRTSTPEAKVPLKSALKKKSAFDGELRNSKL